MPRNSVLTSRAAAPRGAYSQAIRAGSLIFVSGQLPIDENGNLVGLGDIKAQTKAVFRNIKAILEDAGSGLHQVVKTTVFLTNLGDFGGMNEVYGTAFSPPYPARSTVEISGLPNGMLLEIECTAFLEREQQ